MEILLSMFVGKKWTLRIQNCSVLQSETYQPKPTHSRFVLQFEKFCPPSHLPDLSLIFQGRRERKRSKTGKYL